MSNSDIEMSMHLLKMDWDVDCSHFWKACDDKFN